MNRSSKSKINRRIISSLKRISFVMLSLFLILSFGKIQGTNSFFMDTATSVGNTMTAGVWIPEITVTADHAPDGDDGWYQPAPCFKVTSTISDTTIFWTLAGDHLTLNGNYAYDSDVCVPIPEGIWTLAVYAQNNANSDWKSATTMQDYKVDTTDPVAEITAPTEGASVSGSFSIRGTASDLYIKSYRLQITGPDNYDSGYVATPGFTNSWIRTWDTSAVTRGDYQIKLTARDLAGHETSDEIGVTVVKAGDVVINEVMWMGSTQSSSDKWIELRNTTGDTLNIGHWTIENAKHSGNNKITIPDGKTIDPHGFFLIAKYDQSDSNSKLNVGVDDVDSSISLNGINNGNLILRDSNDTIIDQAKGSLLWPAGWHGILFHMSMERNNAPGDGLTGGSWHTCVDSHCNDTTYWDDAGANYGTPEHANLSVNDPSAPEYDPAFMEQEYFDAQETAPDDMSTDASSDTPAPADDTIAPAVDTPEIEAPADPAPAIEDPVVEVSAPPADPEVAPETTPVTETEVTPDTDEEPVVEEEKPVDVPAKKEEVKKDDAVKPDDAPADNSEDNNSTE